MTERQEQLKDVIGVAIENALANLHTATIAKVTGINTSTINCQPVINRVVNGESVQLPEFVDVPPVTLQGGGSYVATPIAVGDYCLLVITERCFDRWYNSQDFQEPLELRLHDYSDGIAIVGVNPLASAIPIPSETTIKGIMRLGTVDPSDWMALAGKVLSELDGIKSDLDAIKTAYNGHTHGGSVPVPVAQMTLTYSPSSVASDFVKGD